MGLFKKNKKVQEENYFTFEANSDFHENQNNIFQDDINDNDDYINSNDSQEDFDVNKFVNKRFNYKKANKKIISDEEYKTMIDEDYAELKMNKKDKIKSILLILLGSYIFILVLGIISTPIFDRNGTNKAEIVTVEMLSEREIYNKLRVHYVQLSKIIQKTQEVDKLLNNSTKKEYFDISAKYNDILPDIDKNIPKAKAIKTDKYSIIQTQTVNTYNDLAIYLQKISTALSTDSPQTFSEAISWEKKSLEDYEILKNNMYQFADKLKVKEKDSFWNIVQ